LAQGFVGSGRHFCHCAFAGPLLISTSATMFKLEPKNQDRKCSDIICVPLFILAIGGVIAIGVWATINGDVNKITHGYNYEGELCGVDNDEAVMFWCESSEDPGSLDFQHPVCRSSCPTTTNTSGACFGSAVDVGFQTSTTPDYPTHTIGGAFCMPLDASLLHQAANGLASTDLSIIMKVVEVEQSETIIYESVCLALILCTVYVFVMPLAVQILVCSAVAVIVVMFVVIGTVIIIKYCGGLDGDVDGDLTTENTPFDLAVGLLLLVLALVTCVCCGVLRKKLDTAKDLLDSSVEFLCEVPSTVLLVVFNLFVTIGLLAVTFIYGALILSTAELVSVGDTYQYEVEAETWVFFFVFLALMLWIVNIFKSWLSFSHSWAVQAWYFAARGDGGGSSLRQGFSVPWLPGFFGLLAGAKSIGSFTLAGLVKTLFGWNIGLLAEVLKIVCGKFTPITFLDNLAFSGMCHDASLGFCAAGASVFVRDTRSSPIFGTGFIFELVGIILIPLLGGAFTFWNCRTFRGDTTSNDYVAEPKLVAILSAFVILLVVYPTLGALSDVADNIAFCDVVDEEEAPEQKGLMHTTKKFFTGNMREEGSRDNGRRTETLKHAKENAI